MSAVSGSGKVNVLAGDSSAAFFGPRPRPPYRGGMTKNNGIKVTARIELLLPVLAVLSLSACMATVGVDARSIPADAAQTCARHCQTIGMRLSAVAIMADNVGCVCQPAGAPTASAADAGELGTPAGGMTTIAAQQAAAASQSAAATAALQQQQRQQQQQQYRYY